MHYLIYEVKNNINGKIYIGKHKTNDINDDYMGSGKILKRSIEKYGIENFTKTILFELETEQEMNDKEAEIVNEEFIRCGSNYNLMVGGQGGWDYINDKCKPRRGFSGDDRLKAIKVKEKLRKCNEWDKNYKEKQSLSMKEKYKNGLITFKGKTHSEETKKRIGEANSKHQTGTSNSQFGTMWIHNLEEKLSKKIKKEEFPKYEKIGWLKGRKMKF